MALPRILSIVVLFSARIWQSSSYTAGNYHQKTPNVCGGYCRGNSPAGGGPCWAMSGNELDICEWANDFCCPPNGDPSLWTTTTTPDPNMCGGFCTIGLNWPYCHTRSDKIQCEWALRVCCPPNGDGSQWTTIPTTTTEKDESGKMATWVIVVIAVGAVLIVGILVGLGICFCVYFNGQKRKRRVNPGGAGGETPAYGYPGTGARPGLYQPVIQPQAQFTNDSPFYA